MYIFKLKQIYCIIFTVVLLVCFSACSVESAAEETKNIPEFTYKMAKICELEVSPNKGGFETWLENYDENKTYTALVFCIEIPVTVFSDDYALNIYNKNGQDITNGNDICLHIFKGQSLTQNELSSCPAFPSLPPDKGTNILTCVYVSKELSFDDMRVQFSNNYTNGPINLSFNSDISAVNTTPTYIFGYGLFSNNDEYYL